MNFNFDLFIDVLWLGTLCGIIATICLQKLKTIAIFLNNKFISIPVNIFIGFFMSRLFTNLSIKMSLCVGIITWIGAETIYDQLKAKKVIKEDRITQEESSIEEIEDQ